VRQFDKLTANGWEMTRLALGVSPSLSVFLGVFGVLGVLGVFGVPRVLGVLGVLAVVLLLVPLVLLALPVLRMEFCLRAS
jgi:hypothetical protein